MPDELQKNHPTTSVHGGSSAVPTPANVAGWGDRTFRRGGSEKEPINEGEGHVPVCVASPETTLHDTDISSRPISRGTRSANSSVCGTRKNVQRPSSHKWLPLRTIWSPFARTESRRVRVRITASWDANQVARTLGLDGSRRRVCSGKWSLTL